MKIIIFGNGYLGSNIYNFYKDDHKVYLISNSSQKKNGINSILFKNISKHNNKFKNTDLLILANGLPSEICDIDLIKGAEFNILNTILIIEKFISLNCKKIIYFSSIHVYGDSLKGNLNEKLICNPSTPYKINKLYIEKILNNISKKNKNTSILILRLSNVYGYIKNQKSVNWNLFLNFFAKNIALNKDVVISSNGNSYRNIIHIERLCQTINYLALNYHNYYEIINIGSELNLSLHEYFNLMTNLIEKYNIRLIKNENDNSKHFPFKYDLSKIDTILNNSLFSDEKYYLKKFLEQILNENK
jgi:nucleoside-diphosphate-sugar epimerase